MLGLGLAVLALTAACYGGTTPQEETSSRGSGGSGPALSVLIDEYNLGSQAIEAFFTNTLGYLESLCGQETVHTGVMFVEMVLRFVAEGAASGLNVIAVYVSEILRVTGVGDPVSIPHFTPEGVFSVAKWALIAVIGYWLVCVVLRVAMALLKRVFWLLKLVVVARIFVRIVSDPNASPETTATRLSVLVVFCAVVSVATRAASGTNLQWMENRLKSLEERIKVLEKTKWSDD
ncbi:voltage-gated monoatomic cation channel TMEM109 isoform X1 [Brachyhypopomus gauderio]|uniref:voltage-gated monoatomic cation channel TMEM109 isoform X1 n=1 Tax=Brachyhypopomus gauderio TaxID=698409 RepID=UPI00404316F4